mmetsp:Transcript_5512/g.5033  ORF Transcript_5512/g.5033 Transcript_5512/m.5033 type:complete len:162 (+) Transcript_5512:915-1400(+)
MAYEECKVLSDKFLLPNQVVYELHAEFHSLLEMAEQKQDGAKEDDDDEEVGIPLGMFVESFTCLKEKHPEISNRILEALGISLHAKNSKIKWGNFLMLNSLCRYFTAQKHEFINFWLKVINPLQYKTVTKVEFIDILEKLARGSYTENNTLISQKYSKQFY